MSCDAGQLPHGVKSYVNQATGSDTLDSGRGESEEKPFKTIQACVDYVCDNYNLSRYSVTIYVADGIYGGTLELPSYTSSTGSISLRSTSGDPDTVVTGPILCIRACTWNIYSITAKQSDRNRAGWGNTINVQNSAVLNLYDVVLDASDFTITAGSIAVIGCTYNGTVNINGNSEENVCGLTIKLSKTADVATLIRLRNGGTMVFTADLTIEGDHDFSSNTVNVQLLSTISFAEGSATYPGRAPVIVANGTYTGRRYYASNNAIIATGGLGAEAFPGDTNGVLETGAQYS